jgi:hypothetical protein
VVIRGRRLIAGALTALVLALCALLSAEQASATQRTAAATAVPAPCGHAAAYSHRNRAFRSLSSADSNKLVRLCARAKRSVSKVRFWYHPKHRWTLYLNQASKKCWQVELAGPQKLCLLARAQVRIYGGRLARLRRRITDVTRPRLPPLLVQAFSCIHQFEGAWNANTGNGYYGGLQMDTGFPNSYGAAFVRRWGTADHWPVWAQLQAAITAYRSGRGFYPWPNTARMCGLL